MARCSIYPQLKAEYWYHPQTDSVEPIDKRFLPKPGSWLPFSEAALSEYRKGTVLTEMQFADFWQFLVKHSVIIKNRATITTNSWVFILDYGVNHSYGFEFDLYPLSKDGSLYTSELGTKIEIKTLTIDYAHGIFNLTPFARATSALSFGTIEEFLGFEEKSTWLNYNEPRPAFNPLDYPVTWRWFAETDTARQINAYIARGVYDAGIESYFDYRFKQAMFFPLHYENYHLLPAPFDVLRELTRLVALFPSC